MAAALTRSAAQAAEFLRAVAHPGRLRIICVLLEREQTATELARRVGIRAAALSQQAAVLEARGIITRRREARRVLYRLASPAAADLSKLLYKHFCVSLTRGRRAGRLPGVSP